MTYTKTRNAAPPARSAATLDAERQYYAYYANRTPASVTAVGRQTSGPSGLGGSSSVMVPVVGCTGQQPATLRQLPTIRHHPRYLPPTAIRRRPVDGEAAVAVFIALALYVVLVVLLIATSSRPAPVHHADDSARPLSTNSAPSAMAPTLVAPAAPSLPVETAKPIAPQPIVVDAATKAAPLPTPNAAAAAAAAPKASAVARREKALDLLRKARESQADTIVYRQTLAELVRSYGDTPAGAEALNLLAAVEPANTVSPTPADKREETPELKQADEKTVPRAHYGLGLMD